MSADFKDYIENVREKADLFEVMLEDVSGMTEHGGVFRGAEDWPSLIAWPNGTWRDFGGDRGGDVFSWLQEIRSWSFMQAADYLADRYGVERMERSAEQEARYVAQHAIGKVLEASFIYYHNALPSKIRNEVLRDHYAFTDETIDRLMLGWAGPQVEHKGRNGRLFEYLRGEGFKEDQCLASGLFIKFKNGKIVDFFADRIVFPYWKHGMPKYAIARRCDPYSGDDPHELAKYKKLLTHSDKHPYVSDHIENSIFYNEDAFTGVIDVGLVTEGVTDCISAMQAGIPCISPVTVRFRDKDTEKLVRLAKRIKRLVICNDSEASGAGEKGAVKTASILFAQGVDARLAQLPKPEGVDKIDVNEFLCANSGEELLSVLEHATRLPEYLIERVSPATEPSQIGRKLEPAIDVLVGMAVIEQTSYIAIIAKRFKVGKADVKKLIRDRAEFLKKKKREAAKEEQDQRERLKGEISEGANFYYTHNVDGDMIVVSSFKIVPTERVSVEGVEQITGDILTDKNKTIKGVVFPPNAWQGRRQFLAAITRVSPDLQWTGSDDQVQGLLRIVADADVIKRIGSTMLGWWDSGTNDNVRWVTPHGIIGPNGIEVDDQLAYVANGSPLAARVKYTAVDEAKVKEIAAEVLPNLMKLNTPAVMLPLIGWYFAAPYRKPITDLLGHFPILWNWGTQGSGKTSLQLIFWRIHGVTDAEPFSATETEFSMLRLLSSTNGVPIILDEYKPADMLKRNVNRLMRYVRRVYGGETESRGRPDLTLANYVLAAPLSVTGENKPDHDPAVSERILCSSPNKNTIELSPEHHRAFALVRRADLGALALPMIQFAVQAPVTEWLDAARSITNRFLAQADDDGKSIVKGAEDVPTRVVDNLVVMGFGLIVYQRFAESLGVLLPDPDFQAAIAYQCDDFLEGEAGAKDVFDQFLESLSACAQEGTLREGVHYAGIDGEIALHVQTAYGVYLRERKKMGLEDATNGLRALRRVIREKIERGSYIKRNDARVKLAESTRRCVRIKVDEIPTGLDIEPFPVDNEKSWGFQTEFGDEDGGEQ